MGLGPTDRARNQPFFGGVPHPPDPTEQTFDEKTFFLRLRKDIFFCGWGQLDGVVFGGVFPTEPTSAISVGSGYRDQTQPGTETHAAPQ